MQNVPQHNMLFLLFFFQAEDGIRDWSVTGVQTCALPISTRRPHTRSGEHTTDFQSLTTLVCCLLLEIDRAHTISTTTDPAAMPSAGFSLTTRHTDASYS